MRVTDVSKHKTVQANLQKTSKSLQDSQIALSNGKRLNKPSDDPVGAAMVQDYRTSINHSQNIEKNIGHDMVWLDKTESTITQLADTTLKIKSMAMQGANGSATAEERRALAEELWMITEDFTKLANSMEGKLYLFAGTKTFTKPIVLNPRMKEAELVYEGTRMKSGKPIIPVDQTKPMPGLTPGSLTLKIKNANEPDPELQEGQVDPNLVTIQIEGNETPLDVLRKLNEAAIAQENWVADTSYPGGYQVRFHASMGADQYVYLDPASQKKIEVVEDTTGFTQAMGFETITGVPTEDGLGMQSTISAEEYEALFKGWTAQPMTVKILRGGTYGEARYTVSDDGGNTWSQPQALQKQIEVYNPEGRASEKVFLEFHAPGQPYFKEGVEFKFEGNEFVEYHGNDQIKYVPIDNGIKVALNITASELFRQDPTDPETVNTFDVLNRLIESLHDDDQQSLLKSLDELDLAHKQLLKWQSQVGATVQELEASKSRIQDSMDYKAAEISEIEDLDLAKGSMDLNKAEVKNQVNLDSAARLIQPTLINFLK